MRSRSGARTGGIDVTIQFATETPLDLEPVPHPKPVDRLDYKATTCPLCLGPLQERIRGLYCVRDRGWLVEKLVDGVLVYSLWQGKP